MQEQLLKIAPNKLFILFEHHKLILNLKSYSMQTENQKSHLKLIKLNYDKAKLVPEHFCKLFSEITEVIWRICKVNLHKQCT